MRHNSLGHVWFFLLEACSHPKEKQETGKMGNLGWKPGECAVCLSFTVQVLDVVGVVAFVVVHPAVAVAGDVAGLESAAGYSPDPRHIRLR